MPQVVECRCRQRFNAADSLVGSVVPCPACGAPITIPAASPTIPANSPPSNPHGAASEQFRRDPFWYLLHGVDVAAYQPGQTSAATLRAQKFLLLGLAMVVPGLAILTLLIATARFGLAVGAMMALASLGVAFVPLLFGFYFLTTGLLESQVLMMSRRGRGVRYLFGDQGARWFFIICGLPALVIGLVIQLAFVAGAAIGRDPNRNRNAPAQLDNDAGHQLVIPAPQGAAADRARQELLDEMRKANAEVLKDPAVAAEFEKSIRDRLGDR